MALPRDYWCDYAFNSGIDAFHWWVLRSLLTVQCRLCGRFNRIDRNASMKETE